MNSAESREQEIIRSWHCNAGPWSEAIRTASIASRKLVTNQAIIDAVASVAPSRVLDIGCGEGWLARALSGLGMSVTGVDVVPELIARAMTARDTPAALATSAAATPGSTAFLVQDYAAIASRRWCGGPFHAAVCNFSLLGLGSVEC